MVMFTLMLSYTRLSNMAYLVDVLDVSIDYNLTGLDDLKELIGLLAKQKSHDHHCDHRDYE